MSPHTFGKYSVSLHPKRAVREPLTPKQHNLVDFVRRYGEQHGYALTFEEIRRELGYRSLATVEVERPGALALIGAGRERLRRRSKFPGAGRL